MPLIDFLKGATEIGRAMGTTLKHLGQKPVTVEYPRDPVPLYPRFRGKHELRRYENGMERCIGCMLCEAACPTAAIYVEAAENDPDHPTSPGERYAKTYEINMLRCIFCGYCEDACPTNAIVLEPIEFPTGYTRESMIYTKTQLLESPPINVAATPQNTPAGKYDRAILPFPPVDSSV